MNPLIANFEPNEIATKSACPPRRRQKTKIQTRKHRAGEAAQKVGMQSRIHCEINQNEDLIMAAWTNEPFPASRHALALSLRDFVN
jgi:hypothetical protein